MSVHYYDPKALTGDYVRAGIGFALTAGPLLFVDLNSIMVYLLGGLALLFAVFGVRTAQRQVTKLELADEGVRSVGPAGTAIRWDELERVELRFFSTQRARREGWMQLKLKGGGRVIRVDSTISDFTNIARVAAMKAIAAGIPLDRYSVSNFQALNVDLPEDVANAEHG
ncbi:MAG: hypothetical protein MI806_01705 [Minwuiales bacterium]|nr:hypothetical protein [Minwuiales bacterium]